MAKAKNSFKSRSTKIKHLSISLEQSFWETQERFQGLADNIGIGVAQISPKMEILFLNRQMKEWFPKIDTTKKPICYKAYNTPPGKHICSYCPTIKTLKTGKVHEAITHTPQNGKIVNYRIIASPIKNQQGKVMSALELVEDITARKKVEEEVLRHQKMLKISQNNLQKFSRKLLSVREDEKKKISADLHDELGGMSISVSASAAHIEKQIKDHNYSAALKALIQYRQSFRKSVERMKKIALDLLPPNLSIIGLPAAINQLIEQVTFGKNIKVKFKHNIGKKQCDEEALIALYRITQEALTNVIRHSRADEVLLKLNRKIDRTTLYIKDNGDGFNLKRLLENPKSTKIGIQGMRERIGFLGGKFSIESSLGQGTKINVEILCKG